MSGPLLVFAGGRGSLAITGADIIVLLTTAAVVWVRGKKEGWYGIQYASAHGRQTVVRVISRSRATIVLELFQSNTPHNKMLLLLHPDGCTGTAV